MLNRLFRLRKIKQNCISSSINNNDDMGMF
jgi:hypothetical protein